MKNVGQHIAVAMSEQQACYVHKLIMIEGVHCEHHVAILEVLVQGCGGG